MIIGSAEVVIKAITTGVARDIKAALRDARVGIKEEGSQAGKSYAEGFNSKSKADIKGGVPDTLRGMRDQIGREGEEGGKRYGTGFTTSSSTRIQDGIVAALGRAGSEANSQGNRHGQSYGQGFSSSVTTQLRDAVRNGTSDDSSNQNAGRRAASAFGGAFRNDVSRSSSTSGNDSGSSFVRAFNQSVGKLFNIDFSKLVGTGLESAIKGAQAAFQSLYISAATIGPIIAIAAGAISTLASGLGLAALAAAQAAGALAVLPGIIAAIAQGGIVLAVATKGIGEAIKAGLAPKADTAAKSAKSLASAANEAANRARAIAQAQKAVARAYEDAAERSDDALQRVEDAEADLADAQNKSWIAQLKLTDARDAGAESLQQLGFAAEDAVLGEQRAAFGLQDALEDLQKVQDQPPGTRARDEAELAFKEAELQYRQSKDRAQDLTEEQAKAAEAGIEGTKEVIDAKNDIADADQGVLDAQKRLADAQEAQADAARQNARAIEDANEQLANAQRLMLQSADSTDTATASVDKYAEAVKNLSPSQKAFTDAVIASKDTWLQLKQALGENFFAGLDVSFNNLTSLVTGKLRPGLEQTSSILNTMAKQLIGVLTGGEGANLLGAIIDGNNRIMQVFTDTTDGTNSTVENLTLLLLRLAQAIQPLTEQFAHWIDKTVEGWATATDPANGTVLEDFFRRAGAAAAAWGDIFGNVWDAFKGLLKGAQGPIGDFLVGLTKITQGWEDFVNARNTGKNNKIEEFFEDIMFVGGHILDFLKEITIAFVKMGTNSDIAETFSQLAKTVSENFDEMFRQLADIGPYIARALDAVIRLGNQLGQSQGFQTFFKVIKAGAEIILDFLQIPLVGAFLGIAGPIAGAILAFKLLGSALQLVALNFVGAVRSVADFVLGIKNMIPGSTAAATANESIATSTGLVTAAASSAAREATLYLAAWERVVTASAGIVSANEAIALSLRNVASAGTAASTSGAGGALAGGRAAGAAGRASAAAAGTAGTAPIVMGGAAPAAAGATGAVGAGATTAVTGIKKFTGALKSFGGALPGIGLAVFGVATAIELFSDNSAEAAEHTIELEKKSNALGDTIDETTGAFTDQSKELINADLKAQGLLETMGKLGVRSDNYIDAVLGGTGAQKQFNKEVDAAGTKILNSAADYNMLIAEADKLGISSTEVNSALKNQGPELDLLKAKLANYETGVGSAADQTGQAQIVTELLSGTLTETQAPFADLGKVTQTYNENLAAAKQEQEDFRLRQEALGITITDTGDHLSFTTDELGLAEAAYTSYNSALGDSTTEQDKFNTAADKTIERLDNLSGERNYDDAFAALNEQIRTFNEGFEFDEEGNVVGLTNDLIDVGGAISTVTEEGDKLRDNVLSLRDAGAKASAAAYEETYKAQIAAGEEISVATQRASDAAAAAATNAIDTIKNSDALNQVFSPEQIQAALTNYNFTVPDITASVSVEMNAKKYADVIDKVELNEIGLPVGAVLDPNIGEVAAEAKDKFKKNAAGDVIFPISADTTPAQIASGIFVKNQQGQVINYVVDALTGNANNVLDGFLVDANKQKIGIPVDPDTVPADADLSKFVIDAVTGYPIGLKLDAGTGEGLKQVGNMIIDVKTGEQLAMSLNPLTNDPLHNDIPQFIGNIENLPKLKMGIDPQTGLTTSEIDVWIKGENGQYRKINVGIGTTVEAAVAEMDLAEVNRKLKAAGGATIAASGGYISGPGGDTDDKIPAWLSNGEFVIRAAAVRKYGKNLLSMLNYGAMPKGILPGFAYGGIVQNRSAIGVGLNNKSGVDEQWWAEILSSSMNRQKKGRSDSKYTVKSVSGVPKDSAHAMMGVLAGSVELAPKFESVIDKFNSNMRDVVVGKILAAQAAANLVDVGQFNPSGDPSTFGWNRGDAYMEPFQWKGFNVQVAQGTGGVWEKLLNFLGPLIPGGIVELGGYENRRNVNNPSQWSYHSYGLAMDINWSANPNGVRAIDRTGQYVIPTGPADTIAAMLGMVWGGRFPGTPDGMHFEIHVPPSGIRSLASRALGALGALLGIGDDADLMGFGQTRNMDTINPIYDGSPANMARGTMAMVGPIPPGPLIERWRPVYELALRMEGQSTSWVDRMLFQMSTESSGIPLSYAIDDNYYAGHPSKGLLQVIPPTFRDYARPGFNKNIWDPLSNALASIRYVLRVYKSFTAGYQGRPYDTGGMMGHNTFGVNMSGRPERVLSPRQTESFETLVDTLSRSDSSYITNNNVTSGELSKRDLALVKAVAQTMAGRTGDTHVRVFIGERELTDIIDTQVIGYDYGTARAISIGRKP